MPLFDLPLAELRNYRPQLDVPADLDAFWAQTLQDTARHDLDAQFAPVADTPFSAVEVVDVSYRGFGGAVIKGWLLLPAGGATDLPCLVKYLGYGGGRGLPIEHLAPVAAGFACFVMDTRGQGAGWSMGDTPDDVGAGPAASGCMTRGILDPEVYYYRRLFADAARAVEAAAAHPRVDADRIGVIGGSQGGGLSLAAAALAKDRVRFLAPDVPFLCHFRRATELTDDGPYSEIARFCNCHRDKVERVFRTLAYFDCANLAPRITAPALVSVGMMDKVCPPSTVFAAYNALGSKNKDIKIYAYNGHEGGGAQHQQEVLRFAQEQLNC